MTVETIQPRQFELTYSRGVILVLLAGVFWSTMGLGIRNVVDANAWFAAAPFVAAILGWAILKESVSRLTWIAMLFAMIGVVVMVADGFSAGQASGNLAAILSAIGFAVFSISLRWGRLGDMMPAVFLAGIFTAATSFIICQVNDYPLMLTVNDASIAIAMGVFQVGAGLTLYTIGSKVVPAAQLTLLSMTEVILGPFWVWLFLGETFGVYTLIGGVILMLAIGFNALSGLRA